MIAPIVFVGDSITHQWEHHRAETFRAFGFINRGIGGETSRQIALRLRAELESTGARGVHLMCGINDIAQNEGFVPVEDIQRNIAGMLDVARDMGVRAWVGAVTPSIGMNWHPAGEPAPMIAAVNAWLEAHAHEHGAEFIDYHAVLAAPDGALRESYGTDGVHLSAAGYAAIEPVLLAALDMPPHIQADVRIGRRTADSGSTDAGPRWRRALPLTSALIGIVLISAIVWWAYA